MRPSVGMNVFLIEDYEDIALVVREALRREGFEVVHFKRALEFFSRIEKEVSNLVIID